MSFLTGRVAYLRFRVDGPAKYPDDAADRLHEHRIGTARIASADGVDCGWAAGDHVLDTAFSEKNVLPSDALCFDFAVETNKLPADKLKAYYEVELKALSANNPSGIPSAKQKREAKETARDRLEQEAEDGRFKKRKCVPVLWDGRTGDVLFGATSLTHLERFTNLFAATFGVRLAVATAGPLATNHPGYGRFTDGSHESPTAFLPGQHDGSLAWIADELSGDFLGNEFLLWLWFFADCESDTVKLGDGSEVTFMFARSLVVDCPRGVSGVDGFKSEGPTRLPEARRAVQAGKLPRRAGLILVRHDQQYELTLQAETFAVSGCKLPPCEEETAAARRDERVLQVRHLMETTDALYAVFCELRLGSQWPGILERIQRWIANGERKAVT